MKELDEESLSTAILLGTDICKEAGLCCEKRGRIIFQIYKKLEDLKSVKPLKPLATEGGNVGEPSQIEAEKPHGLQVN